MDEFTLFLIIFPIIMALLFWLKRSSDRNYGTPAERAAEAYGYSPAPQPERTKRPKNHETANAYAFTAPAPIAQPTARPAPPAGPPPVLFDAVWHHLMKAV
ncbi:MAG TPA: hypothetical protein VK364_11655, partial [Hymenobacter sp.]|nr:hypothetical protein [Hymenobacter sp.]